MNGDEDGPSDGMAVPGFQETFRNVRQASFFLAGKGLCLPVRLVKKIDRFAQRALAEPRRRLCP